MEPVLDPSEAKTGDVNRLTIMFELDDLEELLELSLDQSNPRL
jgi:hypothetical protein